MLTTYCVGLTQNGYALKMSISIYYDKSDNSISGCSRVSQRSWSIIEDLCVSSHQVQGQVQILWNVVTCPYFWYLLLAHKPSIGIISIHSQIQRFPLVIVHLLTVHIYPEKCYTKWYQNDILQNMWVCLGIRISVFTEIVREIDYLYTWSCFRLQTQLSDGH